KKISNKVESVSAQYIHDTELESELNSEQERIVKSLLNSNREYGIAQPMGHTVIIAPIVGTISPWSSKATDINKNTGIKAVKRIERAI
ncbi:hypothetical protein, partial [Francisella tularensis]|uniref:hypothetical protein n=1 Tax=Francisella tularensis TaxID=263 RepID=UPI002381A701